MTGSDIGRRTAAQELDDHSAVVSFLSRSGTYAKHPKTVEQRVTHAAIVFLAGEDAYKIKRPVRYSYLDFSTIEKRRAALAHEFQINKPNAPDIYQGVVAITRDAGGGLRIGGMGEVIEWALHMRRFDDTGLLDAEAQRGPLPAAVCTGLADAVFEQHRRASVSHDAESPSQMRAILGDVTGALRNCAALAEQKSVQRLLVAGEAAIARLTPLLNLRAAQGYVRHCHGDLHLGNIVLLNEAPVLFDAIEFDDRLATIDTLYDLAFLLMDLEHRHQREAANRVLNRYVWRSQQALDLEGLAALPLFLALRAAVRAMVAAQRLTRSQTTPIGEGLGEVSSYLSAALSYLVASPARLVAIGGFSGTGKSTLGAALSPHIGAAPGALHLRSDLERKAYYGAAEFERLKPATYTPQSSRIIYDRLFEKAGLALKAGCSVVLDAVFAKHAERSRVADIASKANVHYAGIWLDAPLETLKTRVAERRNDASDATAEVVEQQHAYDTGPIDWIRIDSGNGPQRTLDCAQALLEEHFSSP